MRHQQDRGPSRYKKRQGSTAPDQEDYESDDGEDDESPIALHDDGAGLETLPLNPTGLDETLPLDQNSIEATPNLWEALNERELVPDVDRGPPAMVTDPELHQKGGRARARLRGKPNNRNLDPSKFTWSTDVSSWANRGVRF